MKSSGEEGRRKEEGWGGREEGEELRPVPSPSQSPLIFCTPFALLSSSSLPSFRPPSRTAQSLPPLRVPSTSLNLSFSSPSPSQFLLERMNQGEAK